MPFRQQTYSKILTFLPGLIVLAFGMLALYSSVSMIELMSDISVFIKDSFNRKIFIENLDQREIWLYWSVITIGLTSFIIVILNANKLNELKKINEEKQRTLSELNERISALEFAKEGIFITDSDGLITYMNKAIFVINGLGLRGKKCFLKKDWLSIFSDSDKEDLEENTLSEFYETGSWSGNFTMYRSDNSIIHTDLSLTKLPDGGIIGTIQDISEQYKAECERKNLEDQFYQAQKMEAIGRLAGGIAHDFNNILAAMNGYAGFLKDDLPEDSEQYKFAENILQAGLQARELVDQMLAFSRTSDSENTSLDLIIPVSEAITMITATMSKLVTVNSNYSISNAPIFGNTTHISQLIMNLCVNAMDAMEDEGGELNINIDKVDFENIEHNDFICQELPDPKATPVFRMDDVDAGHTRLFLGHIAKGHNYARLSVLDSGTGMSRVVMEHIFEPFFTTKPVDKGTGLGLSTVHGTVVSHQGFMVIDSILGKGTSFHLYFPLTQEAPFFIEEESIDNIVDASSNDKKHILLVEDQENVHYMQVVLLKRLGYEVSSAMSGLEGLDMVRENPTKYDLIITDYNMPEMTGLEMVQQIHFDLPDMPFILVSGYSEEKIRSIIDHHDAIKAVMQKPVSKEALSEKIKSVLSE